MHPGERLLRLRWRRTRGLALTRAGQAHTADGMKRVGAAWAWMGAFLDVIERRLSAPGLRTDVARREKRELVTGSASDWPSPLWSMTGTTSASWRRRRSSEMSRPTPPASAG